VPIAARGRTAWRLSTSTARIMASRAADRRTRWGRRVERYGAPMPRAVLLVVAAVAAVLFAAPSAHALIQVDRGIAGVRIGSSQAEVRAALGAPARVVRGRNEFGRFVVFRYAGGIRVTFQGGRQVSTVSTTGLGDRTAGGIGVGSTEGAVDQGVPGVLCEAVAGDRLCHTGDFRPGERMTVFVIRAGEVFRVDVGIVID
jgi:hypothetical protein